MNFRSGVGRTRVAEKKPEASKQLTFVRLGKSSSRMRKSETYPQSVAHTPKSRKDMEKSYFL